MAICWTVLSWFVWIRPHKSNSKHSILNCKYETKHLEMENLHKTIKRTKEQMPSNFSVAKRIFWLNLYSISAVWQSTLWWLFEIQHIIIIIMNGLQNRNVCFTWARNLFSANIADQIVSHAHFFVNKYK